MLRVALTGGIAAGKTHVGRALARRGIPVVEADAIARDVVAPGTPGLAAVVSAFGPGMLATDGSLDRGRLAARVFDDAAARAALEAIVHPAVYERIQEWLAARRAEGAPVAVADVPLLFETGRAAAFDAVIAVVCEPAEQLRRLQARDGLSEEAARRRLAAQWPVEEKAARADFVVRTDGSHADTDRQVAGLAADLLELAAGRAGSDR